MQKYLAYVVLLLCTINSVFGLYFQIAETERKCFFEDLPKGAPVIVTYELELNDSRSNGFIPPPNTGLHIEVRDNDDSLILSRVYRSKGQIKFISATSDFHVICMHPNSTALFSGSQLRLHLKIQVNEHAKDYASRKAQIPLRLDELRMQSRFREILDQMEQINTELIYQRYREEDYRNINASTDASILWWIIAQTIIFAVLCYCQKRSLKEITKHETEEEKSHLTRSYLPEVLKSLEDDKNEKSVPAENEPDEEFYNESLIRTKFISPEPHPQWMSELKKILEIESDYDNKVDSKDVTADPSIPASEITFNASHLDNPEIPAVDSAKGDS